MEKNVEKFLEECADSARQDFTEGLDLSFSYGMAESPIEQLFLIAWEKNNLYSKTDFYKMSSQHEVVCVDFSKGYKYPQVRYRIDFAFIPQEPAWLDLIGGKFPQFPKVAVELDGKDWHEKTKAQAIRDRRRERNLVAEGWTVIRFLGSEVVKNPDNVVSEVFQILTQIESSTFQEIWNKQRKERGNG